MGELLARMNLLREQSAAKKRGDQVNARLSIISSDRV